MLVAYNPVYQIGAQRIDTQRFMNFSNVGSTSATVNWTTNENAKGVVYFSTSTLKIVGGGELGIYNRIYRTK